MKINVKEENDKVAIVVIGYNRIESIKRLLKSVSYAQYDSYDVPLIISLDSSGNEELYDYINGFEWKWGMKYVNIENERLGLKNHIFACCDLSRFFKAVIVLEDDLYVGPVYYKYAVAAVSKYENNDSIAGIALMRNEMNGYAGLPFTPLQNGYDAFALQETCTTTGECFTWPMWSKFREWLVSNEDSYKNVDMPYMIKNWTRAWSK